jgi:cobalt-zinc-cadmium efflux system outer membrane protein
MKIASVLILFALAASVAAEDRVRAFTPEELVTIALADNPELHFYKQQVSALPKPSSAKPLPTIAQPLDFPSRESFRRAVLNLDASLARLYLALFRFVLAGTVRIKAMEYQAASASAITANDLASRISALVTMLEGRPAAGVEALIERRILEGAALPFLRKAAEAKVRGDLLRRELNGLLGRPPDEELSVTGELALPPELVDQAPDDPLLLQIREAEIARGLVGLDAAGEIESFAVGSWFTREGLGASDAIAGITRPGTTAGSTIADTTIRLVEDARTKFVRETAQRRAAVKAARELAAAIPPELIENLRGASDLAERQYRVGALGVNLLIEAHREYLEALESRNQAVIQAWRNSLDLDMLNLPAAPNWLGKVIVSRNGTP